MLIVEGKLFFKLLICCSVFYLMVEFFVGEFILLDDNLNNLNENESDMSLIDLKVSIGILINMIFIFKFCG